MDKLIIYTDGSSTVYHDKNNMRYGGIGVFFGDDNENNISKKMVGPEVSNQRAELLACIEGIKKAISISKKDILIYSDSQYVIKSMTQWANKWRINGWKKSDGKEILNINLIKELDNLTRTHKVTYKHIRSHQPEPTDKTSEKWIHWYGNHNADKFACDAMHEK